MRDRSTFPGSRLEAMRNWETPTKRERLQNWVVRTVLRILSKLPRRR